MNLLVRVRLCDCVCVRASVYCLVCEIPEFLFCHHVVKVVFVRGWQRKETLKGMEVGCWAWVWGGGRGEGGGRSVGHKGKEGRHSAV